MIDWKAQWALHAHNFFDGKAHVDLKEFGGPDRSFKLLPGPGFGDLSHPTTRIMLTLIPKRLTCPVIDIGCGSGVLSLAAKVLGAPEVFGIDIDEDAIAHAQKNSALNGLNCSFGKALLTIPKRPLLLMNMISSEQKKAWSDLPPLAASTLIVSGYPVEEPDPTHYGKIEHTLSLEGWKGFVIQMG